ncbi:MAG: Gfo/Idh/MocA family oxidoreductase [Candidatus Latescibacterota bacterium]
MVGSGPAGQFNAVLGVLLVSFSRHSHQRSFVPVFQDHPRTRILAVADFPDVEPALGALNREWAARLQVPYLEDIEAALGLAGVQIVSIGHEIERRADLAIRAARAGKHLWIDKFIGATVEECDAVVRAVAAAGVKAVVPSFAYGELLRQARALLESGRLGELLGAHVDVHFAKGWPRPLPTGAAPQPFRAPGRWKYPDLKREVLTVGSYGVGLAQACLERVAHVVGQAGAYFFAEHAAAGVDDFGTLTLCDPEGRTVTLSAGRVGAGTHAQGGTARAYLIGTRATAVLDGRRPALEVHLRDEVARAEYRPAAEDPMQWASGPPVQAVGLAPDPVGLTAALDDLICAVDHGTEVAYPMPAARHLMEILIAGYWSVLRGEGVALPLPRGDG